MIFGMEKWGADKNWAQFYKIKWFKILSYQKMLTLKVVLLIHCFYKIIVIRIIKPIFDTVK